MVGDVFPVDVAWAGPEIITWRVLRRVQPGSIIILHDGYVGRFDRDRVRRFAPWMGSFPGCANKGMSL